MAGQFLTTRWSIVLAAGREGPDARRALAELCEVYWPPAYAFLHRKVEDAEQAMDLTQGFFCDLLARGDLERADPERGKFRSYLLKGAQNFAAKDFARNSATKRGGDTVPISLDAMREFEGSLRFCGGNGNAPPGRPPQRADLKQPRPIS